MSKPPQYSYDDDRYSPEPFGEPILDEGPDPLGNTRRFGWVSLGLAVLLAVVFLVPALQPAPAPPRPTSILPMVMPPIIPYPGGVAAARAAAWTLVAFVVTVVVSIFAIVLSLIAARGPATPSGRRSAKKCLIDSATLLLVLNFFTVVSIAFR